MGVAGNLHQLIRWTGHTEKTDLAGVGIEATYVVISGLGKPDYTVGINGDAVGIEFLNAFWM